MTWEIYLAISILAYVCQVLGQRMLLQGKGTNPIAVSIVSNMTGTVFVVLFASLYGVRWSDWIVIWPNLLVMAPLYAVASICIFQSLKLIDASVFTVLFSSRALWAILAAILVLGEVFTIWQIFGTMLILTSVVVVSWKGTSVRLNKGEVLCLIGAFIWGASVINDSLIVQEIDVMLYIPLIFFTSTVAVWIMNPGVTGALLPLLRGKELGKQMLLGLCYALSSCGYLMAYQTGRNAGQIASINQVTTILIVLLSIVLLRERTNLRRKLLATVMSFIGVVLVR